MRIDGVGAFAPRDRRDRQEWSRLAAFCARHGQAAFSRDPHIGGHVTGSAFVLSRDGRAVLLTHHAKLDRWLQLGGHCDGIADAWFVALKEAYEESGLARIRLPRFGPLSDQVCATGAGRGAPRPPRRAAPARVRARGRLDAD
ncbi:hypothetical protein [Antarctobacter sp.]|uniref:hypothetical protein n=1 Tax=Antarctobacter sp. TaxID=1872577 RepID=UPI003A904CF5